jgi:acyl carrier protein
MADAQSLEDAIRRIIVERLELQFDPSEIGPAMDLRDDVGLDSAALLELVAGIEEEFGFEVEVDDIREENFRTVAGLTRYVQSRTGREGDSPAC